MRLVRHAIRLHAMLRILLDATPLMCVRLDVLSGQVKLFNTADCQQIKEGPPLASQSTFKAQKLWDAWHVAS